MTNSIIIQSSLIAIRLFNVLYSVLIFIPLRRLLLRAVGCNVGIGTGLHDGVRFSWMGRFSIGDHSTVNLGCFIDSRGGVSIGKNSMVGRQSSIYTMSHDVNSANFASVRRSVSIGDNVVIFPHVLIMPGVSIGDNAIVYPGSVISRDIGPREIVAGAPARVASRSP